MSDWPKVPEPCLCGDPECRRCFPFQAPYKGPTAYTVARALWEHYEGSDTWPEFLKKIKAEWRALGGEEE